MAIRLSPIRIERTVQVASIIRRSPSFATTTLASLIVLAAASRSASAQAASPPEANDWEVARGMQLSVAARGFHFPTSIAFVPNPGNSTKDPLYYVAELHGTIKVVLRDGTVETFASDFTSFVSPRPVPVDMGESGTAGLCVEPVHGYVFVTYVYRDRTGVLRNGLTRFSTRPQTFGTRPSGALSLDSIFAADRSAESHQIGPCVILGGQLLVSVGDGQQGEISQRPSSTLGKLLRMTLDGEPSPSHAFRAEAHGGSAPYVWARGFRNIFSLASVQGRVFAAENGLNVDRFLEVDPSINYLWSGNDWTIGMNAALVLAPAVSPVQMDFIPPDYGDALKSYRGRFALALAGRAGESGPGLVGDRTVIAIDYDFVHRRVRALPVVLARYRASGLGNIVALGVGPDGLYFAPLFPSDSSGSVIFRLREGGAARHPHVIGESSSAASLLVAKGCLGCHVIGDRGGAFGPNLTRPSLLSRLRARLDSAEYLRNFVRADSLAREPFTSLHNVRVRIANAKPADRPRLWLVNWLVEPQFARPTAAMPSLGLSEVEAETLADYLLAPTLAGTPADLRSPKSWRSILPPARYRYALATFVLGVALGAIAMRRRARETS